MKRRVRARLVGVTAWGRDEAMEDGIVDPEARRSLEAQVKARLEDGSFKVDGDTLPFDYDFEVEDENLAWPLEREVKRRLLDEYIEEFMPDDFVIPTDCDMEWEEVP